MNKLLLATLFLFAGCGGSISTPDGAPLTVFPPPQLEAPPPSLTLEGRPDLGSLPVIRDVGEVPPPPVPPNAPPPDGAVFTPLGTLSGGTSEAFAISDDGSTLTGVSIDQQGGRSPFKWTAGTGMVALPTTVSRPNGEGHALNQDGSLVGGLGILFDVLTAQLWRDSGVSTLPGAVPPSLPPQTVSDLTPDGRIAVGTAGTGFLGYQGYVWEQGDANPTGLGTLGNGPGQHPGSEGHGISAHGELITGLSTTSSGGLSAFAYSGGRMVDLPEPEGLAYSDGWGVSGDASTIVGWSSSQPSLVPSVATLWRNQSPMTLGELPGFAFNSQAYGVSHDGSVVVGAAASSQSFASQAAFIWDAANGMRRLQDVLGSAVPAGWSLLVATEVSSDGSVVSGFGLNPNGSVEAFRAELP